ncbi:MAG: aromatic hydrocarbon degradation protein, partial [Candidatus Marinimicrobia bacterium]|nr:aromatic hydrocarbon degradation protein [Candidatus Neomarinimicrobiota bacterium]
MNKTVTVLLVCLVLVGFVFAGGLMTNTNQSAAWVRTLHRDASTDIDAVYFNPAGLTKLTDGFHFSFSNQYITQTKEVVNNYTYLNESKYVGDVAAPFFPGVYLAYKTGNLAFSAGLNPIGGGGGAEYKTGLPSFEMPVSDLVPGLYAEGQPVTDYDVDVYFEGTSVYLGGQFGVSYKMNDMISVAVGGRYVSAKDTKKGHLKDAKILLDGSWTSASTFFTGAATQYTDAATSATSAAGDLQPFIDGGAGDVTFANLILGSQIDSATVAAIGAGLTAFGFTWDETVYTPATAQASYIGAAAGATASAAEMTAKAKLTGDQEADVIQTGSGFTPIFSLNISPMEGLNIGFRYEHL